MSRTRIVSTSALGRRWVAQLWLYPDTFALGFRLRDEETLWRFYVHCGPLAFRVSWWKRRAWESIA